MQHFCLQPLVLGKLATMYLVLSWTYAHLWCRPKPSSIITQTKSTSSLVNNTGNSYLVGVTYEWLHLYTWPIRCRHSAEFCKLNRCWRLFQKVLYSWLYNLLHTDKELYEVYYGKYNGMFHVRMHKPCVPDLSLGGGAGDEASQTRVCSVRVWSNAYAWP